MELCDDLETYNEIHQCASSCKGQKRHRLSLEEYYTDLALHSYNTDGQV